MLNYVRLVQLQFPNGPPPQGSPVQCCQEHSGLPLCGGIPASVHKQIRMAFPVELYPSRGHVEMHQVMSVKHLKGSHCFLRDASSHMLPTPASTLIKSSQLNTQWVAWDDSGSLYTTPRTHDHAAHHQVLSFYLVTFRCHFQFTGAAAVTLWSLEKNFTMGVEECGKKSVGFLKEHLVPDTWLSHL